MANILILASATIGVTVSRGTGAANLLTANPKEVWLDSASGSAAQINIDLGAAQWIDTVFLGHVFPPAAGATWAITGGVAGFADVVLMAAGPLRAVDRAGIFPDTSHALWTGDPVFVRYLRLTVTQPAGAPLSAGALMVGSAFTPTWNKEWGSGRRVIDTGSATALPDGGFAVVEGVRKGSYSFTLGDLTDEEVDRLYALQLAVGETLPVLVVEDPAATAGQLQRIHYGRFAGLRAYERRNPEQTRWEITIEDWA